MVDRVQVQGLCRFSFPCTGGFKKYHEDLEERRAALYSPIRLDQRLTWFEHVALPALRAQTDKDFTLHLLLGEDFPQPWRDRLMRLIADLPQIVPVFRAAGDHRSVCREVLWAGRDPQAATVAEFRLDDDDAVAVNYVQSLRRNWPRVRKLVSATGRLALDQGKGMVLEACDTGAIVPHLFLTMCWTPGLALYLRPDDTGTIMDFPHHKIWHRVPFVSLTEQVMFIRGDHATNDARTPWNATAPVANAPGDLGALLKTRFDIDLDAFAMAWQALDHG
ncbi:hypothetical protein roselon_01549 [Roseibacterium elongatum DSM 19469]|uniref:Rhamnosyl transferase n=1 Tax=Roseicyclus elongatus DSM 19469 TaxID=1294273 RepID=W8S566_9RHOB|nr:putative rhamnosyl transferase [Roseibacterium elongatum]AHM03931.1 hypothetical protein roselon_01549 [Roseibacterium elongatum DSM 19469]